MTSPKASASVIAAGAIAILGSLFMMLCTLLALLGVSMHSAQQSSPESALSMFRATFVLFFAVAVFGVFTGIGLLRLRNWARISALVWAGGTVFICSLALIFILLIPFPIPPTMPGLNMAAAKTVIVVIYSVPIMIGIWWLILFNQASTKTQFLGTSVRASPALPTNLRCPMPVAIIAGFMLFSVLGMFAMPLLHMPITTILFGHRVRGELGNFFFASSTVLYLAAAIGLLKLKRWSYPLSLGLYAFWTLSGLVTFLSPNFAQLMQEVYAEMKMPASSAATLPLLNNRALALFGLLPTVLLVGILLYYRKRFMEAADAAESSAKL